jgi:hypothetical protein
LISRFESGLSLSAMAISPSDEVIALGSDGGEVVLVSIDGIIS